MAINFKEDRRFGRFKLKIEMIEQKPEVALEILGRCIIFRAEQLYYDEAISYMAWSEMFDKVPDYEQAPKYDFIITQTEKGFITYRAERIW